MLSFFESVDHEVVSLARFLRLCREDKIYVTIQRSGRYTVSTAPERLSIVLKWIGSMTDSVSYTPFLQEEVIREFIAFTEFYLLVEFEKKFFASQLSCPRHLSEQIFLLYSLYNNIVKKIVDYEAKNPEKGKKIEHLLLLLSYSFMEVDTYMLAGIMRVDGFIRVDCSYRYIYACFKEFMHNEHNDVSSCKNLLGEILIFFGKDPWPFLRCISKGGCSLSIIHQSYSKIPVIISKMHWIKAYFSTEDSFAKGLEKIREICYLLLVNEEVNVLFSRSGYTEFIFDKIQEFFASQKKGKDFALLESFSLTKKAYHEAFKEQLENKNCLFEEFFVNRRNADAIQTEAKKQKLV